MSNIDMEVFSFEDLPGEHGLFDFLGCLDNGVYYETPVSWLDVVPKLISLKLRLSRRSICRAQSLRSWRLITWCWAMVI